MSSSINKRAGASSEATATKVQATDPSAGADSTSASASATAVDPSSSSEPPTTTTSSSASPSETPSTTAKPTTTSESSTTTSSTTTESSSTPTTSSSTPTTTTSSPSSTSDNVITTTSSSNGQSSVIVVTQTQTESATSATNSSSATGTTDSPSLSGASAASSSSGLSDSGKIAVAVVVPVVSVALIILAAIFFWRKRKANKAAEEERRKEVEEYGFNPNNDPTLPGMMAAGSVAPKDDTPSGYRGWGTTSAGRKASTNLSSGMGGLAMSDGSGGGYHHNATPSEGTVQYSDGTRPDSGEVEPIGVLGAAPVAANNRNGDIHRGPSNASSAYSAANHSEASEESHMSAAHPAGGYYGDNPYYGEMTGHGAYAADDYQPVIRDVQARRNTRIENAGVYPRQGNAGIAQNF